MNQMSFPKPSPTDPLPLEVWLDKTDRAEVGREPFFRGRDYEYDVFRRAVNSLRAGLVGGGTMIFQGAPGAGKSALMGECMEAVRHHSTREDPWVAVDIRPRDLDSSVAIVKQLIKAVEVESERLSKLSPVSSITFFKKILKWVMKLSFEVSMRVAGMVEFSVRGHPKSESGRGPQMKASEVFDKAAPLLRDCHLVVMVDEAQNTPTNESAQDVIECLHKPLKEISLVTAFFGLSDTEQVLQRCGLSRFTDERLVNLETLLPEDAVCAIRSVFDAYGFNGTSEDREAWVDSLAKLSQGWPQHINRVSVAAARVIQENNGTIRMELLEEALARGKERMDSYYKGRLNAGFSDAWVYRQLALTMEENGGALARHEIGPLTEFARKEKSQTLSEFLTNALHAGLLAPDPENDDRYRVPIPFMGAYLRNLQVSTPDEFWK